jgi:hypothetical protein
MQCKDIADLPILDFLARQNQWVMRTGTCGNGVLLICEAMPAGTPAKLQLAKMGQLIRRKLVSGCICGCRGDFEITDQGRAFLAQHQQAHVQ